LPVAGSNIREQVGKEKEKTEFQTAREFNWHWSGVGGSRV
jgi:hypothetical protein